MNLPGAVFALNVRRIFLIGLAVGALALGMAFAHDPPADNSATNERLLKNNKVTADQQGMGKSDTELTRLIRKKIVSHKDLSTNAHNVKIISIDGVVTLEGPVKNSEEMATINAIADEVAGSTNVNNELEIPRAE
jgi:hyperosmotically inducible periplasmic protein